MQLRPNRIVSPRFVFRSGSAVRRRRAGRRRAADVARVARVGRDGTVELSIALSSMYTTRQKKNGFQPFVFLHTTWILTPV